MLADVDHCEICRDEDGRPMRHRRGFYICIWTLEGCGEQVKVSCMMKAEKRKGDLGSLIFGRSSIFHSLHLWREVEKRRITLLLRDFVCK